MDKKHYGAIDGLRTIACIGIVMMHMRANNHYEISGFIYNTVIPSFTNFVFLFMTVSAFGMCCGYYEKVMKNQVIWSDFYGKRFGKVLPFFALLVVIDLIMSPSVASLYEGFADVTLVFGFLQKPIGVVGVGWFLGLVFVFYLIFPFFCVLLENKRRAWIAFGISLVYNFACTEYFKVGRTNILYSACFFLAGGLIYLYRDEIAAWNRWAVGIITVAFIVLYYIVGGNAAMCILVSATLLVTAIVNRSGGGGGYLLSNQLMRFISGISLEIYLSHMALFRVVEKIGINKLFGTGWLQYFVTVLLVLTGAICFSAVAQKGIKRVQCLIH